MIFAIRKIVASAPCVLPDCLMSSVEPPGSVPLDRRPMFILLSYDDAVNPTTVDLHFSKLGAVRNPNGCPIRATWFVSVAPSNDMAPLTKCPYVKSLQKAGHEIATHTYGHTGDPTIEEILRAKTWLSDNCGVPFDEMRGFRTPYLQHSQNTFDSLHELGVLYDTSITEQEPATTNFMFPYTMDAGIQQNCQKSSGE
jgi:peptidoglycan/xylan/chitin deacetylase (PgdA/CDA1 family)